MDSLGPFCPDASSSHSLFEALLHPDSQTENWVQIPSCLGFLNLSDLFTYSGFYFTFLSRQPKTSSSLKPWRVFGYLQLSPTYPQSCFKRRITFPIKFSVRAPNIISSVWLRFFGNTKARDSDLFFLLSNLSHSPKGKYQYEIFFFNSILSFHKLIKYFQPLKTTFNSWLSFYK